MRKQGLICALNLKEKTKDECFLLLLSLLDIYWELFMFPDNYLEKVKISWRFHARYIFFTTTVVLFCVWLIQHENFSLFSLITYPLTFLFVLLDPLFKAIGKSKDAYQRNYSLLKESKSAFSFLNDWNFDIKIDQDLNWSRQECFEKIIEKNMSRQTPSVKSAFLFMALYKHLESSKDENSKDETLRLLFEKFRKYTFDKITDLKEQEIALGTVWSNLSEKAKSVRGYLTNVRRDKIQKSLFEISTKVKSPQAFSFFNELKTQKKLKNDLRELIKTKFDLGQLHGSKISAGARGSFIVFAKKVPSELHQYFCSLPMIQIPGNPSTKNIPGLRTKAMNAYLLRPSFKCDSAEELGKEFKKRLSSIKRDPKSKETELIIIQLFSWDFSHITGLKVPDNIDHNEFRQAISFFLSGQKPFDSIGDGENPLTSLWKLKMSFHEILENLSPSVLCRRATPKEMQLVDALYKDTASTLGVSGLLDWRDKTKTDVANAFQNVFTKNEPKLLKTDLKHWIRLNDAKSRLRSLSNQIVDNSQRYYEAINN